MLGSGLVTKHPILSPASDLAIARLITRTWIPPPGITYLNLDSDSVSLFNPVWLSATPTQVKCWCPVYADQGLKVSSGITIGIRDTESPNLLTTKATKWTRRKNNTRDKIIYRRPGSP